MPAPGLASLPVVILAGGLGTRLQPVLPDRPKGLADIGSQSFLEIQIRLLRRQGARHFVLCVGHRSEQIQAALGTGRRLGVRIDYSVEQGGLLGTGGALKQTERWFAPRALVLNGDTYFALDYPRLLEFHKRQRNRFPNLVGTLAVSRGMDGFCCGSVTLGESDCLVTRFQEKDAGAASPCWLSAGAYILERSLLHNAKPDEPCSLEREVFPRVLNKGELLAAMKSARPFFDIGTPSGLNRFRDYYFRISNTRRARTWNRRCSSTAME